MSASKLHSAQISLTKVLWGILFAALGFGLTLGGVFAFQLLTTNPADSGNQSYESPLLSDGNPGNGSFDPATDSLEALGSATSSRLQ